MFLTDRLKYNAPLPGEEFKTRDLSVPAEAAKVVFEIDSQHGQDNELCLAILTRTFRTMGAVTKNLHESAKKNEEGGGGGGGVEIQCNNE